MTKYEVKDMLSEYYLKQKETESIRRRLDLLKSCVVPNAEINERIEQLNKEYANAVLKSDFALASVLEIINKLNNADCDLDLLKKYHIDGLSEKVIARQLHLSVEYIRKKRWRAYEKLAKKSL